MFLGYLNNQAKGFPSPMRFLPPKHTHSKKDRLRRSFLSSFLQWDRLVPKGLSSGIDLPLLKKAGGFYGEQKYIL